MISHNDLEATTIWSFPKRGRWASHSSGFPGNWAPQVPRNLILRYSEQGDVVLDPFLGSGTTLIEAKLLGRYGIGFDVNPAFVRSARRRIVASKESSIEQRAFVGDARDLSCLETDSIDLVLLHPPYANAIAYSDLPNDMSRISSVEEFHSEIMKVISETKRVLKPDHVVALMIGDLRRNRMIVPLGFRILDACLKTGLTLREIIIKVQHNCSSTEKWRKIARRMNFLLLMHEYLFVFEN
jgi:DNA modification methylase